MIRKVVHIALVALLAIHVAGCSETSEGATAQTASASCAGITERKMVWVEGGTFTMGEAPRYREEGPARTVEVEGFWISQTEVTNAQFAEFVEATGYRTEAERDPPQIAGAPPEMREPGSAVFRVPTADNPNWWIWVPGADWRHPNGPGSAITGRGNDPVVQVTYNDALAYANWAGASLPTEEQWEFAARAGAAALPEPLDPDGNPQANYYQGVFPARDMGTDGYTSRAPVGCFNANGYGLHDMIGNVWEWTTSQPAEGPQIKIIKGGSFLCAANYCARYRAAARQFQERDLGTDHIGFRVVKRKPSD